MYEAGYRQWRQVDRSVWQGLREEKSGCAQLVEDHRADFIAPADYSENRELDKIVKSILDYTEARIQMERLMRKEQSNKK